MSETETCCPHLRITGRFCILVKITKYINCVSYAYGQASAPDRFFISISCTDSLNVFRVIADTAGLAIKTGINGIIFLLSVIINPCIHTAITCFQRQFAVTDEKLRAVKEIIIVHTGLTKGKEVAPQVHPNFIAELMMYEKHIHLCICVCIVFEVHIASKTAAYISAVIHLRLGIDTHTAVPRIFFL